MIISGDSYSSKQKQVNGAINLIKNAIIQKYQNQLNLIISSRVNDQLFDQNSLEIIDFAGNYREFKLFDPKSGVKDIDVLADQDLVNFAKHNIANLYQDNNANLVIFTKMSLNDIIVQAYRLALLDEFYYGLNYSDDKAILTEDAHEFIKEHLNNQKLALSEDDIIKFKLY